MDMININLMASSSNEHLDHSNPEIVYECISLLDDNSCKKDELTVNCPLCKHPDKNFYCVDCVKSGNFLHSKKKCLERFADKKVTRYKLDAEKAQLLQRYEDVFAKKKQIENLKLEIYKSKEKIHLLKASVESCKVTIVKDSERIKELVRDNLDASSNQEHFVEKLHSMHERHKIQNSELLRANCELTAVQSALQSLIKHRIKELITHIFPITKVSSSQLHKNNSSSDEGQFAELEEAQKTTYVHGQWVLTGSGLDDVQYSVVEPCIPNSGDYSAFTKWCTEHIQGISRDSLSDVDRCQFDKAYGISAALAYTAQLVSILAFYMDVSVPKRCNFSDFCGHESSSIKFLHRVAKLNTNIINLCLSQGVDVSKLSANQTIQNLLLLINSDSKDVDSSSSCDSLKMMESIEDTISKDLLSNDESDSDDMDKEYVHVSEEEEFLPSVPANTSHESNPEQSYLMSSVSSVCALFKTVTGQK